MKIAFTGHRPESFINVKEEKENFMRNLTIFCLSDKITELVIEFIVGGCRGVDSWAAEFAIKNNLPFYLHLPFPFNIYTNKWYDEDKNFLKKQIDICKDVKLYSKDYNSKFYIIRDHGMVDDCDILISWFLKNKIRSGTAATINYANKIGKKVYYLRDMEV